MQRIALTLSLLCLVGAPAAAQSKFQTRWKAKVKAFRAENAKLDASQRHVVLFGSSSMEGWRYAKRVTRFLPEIAPRVLNRGISGDGVGLNKTTGLYNRIQSSVIGAKPTHVFVLNGRNSVGGYGPMRTAARYRLVLQAIRRALPDAVVCVVTCPPTRGKYERIRAKTAELNVSLRAIAKDEGCWLIDLEPKLRDSVGKLKASMTNDGLHFKDAGYRILGEEIQRVVRQSEAPKPAPAPPATEPAQPAVQPKTQPTPAPGSGGASTSQGSGRSCPGIMQRLLKRLAKRLR